MSAAAIRLSPDDNVAVCCRPITAGETIAIDGASVIALDSIDLGHKISLLPLKSGDKVMKDGVPIGSASQAIPVGSWVHIHNMQSDYISAHLRDATGTQ